MNIAGARRRLNALLQKILTPKLIAPGAISSVKRIRENSRLLRRDFKYLGGL